MSAGFFDSVALANHNHTTVPGDGGQLSNLSVSGTVSGSGKGTFAGVDASAIINALSGLAITGTGTETVNPSSAQDLSTLGVDAALALLGG